MKYFLYSPITETRKEISKDDALTMLKKCYAENVCTYDEMLNMVNTYPCGYRQIEVVEE